MAKVLLVEDDPGVREAMGLALRGLGHDVVAAPDGYAGLRELAPGHRHEVVVLDVMMPGIDGFEVCRRVRATDGIPILMLTARNEAVDIVVGLECGADDYVGKPVEPRVLDARIKALLRRVASEPKEPLVALGDLRIDVDGMRVTRDGQDLGLTPMELKLLVFLVRNAGQVLSRHLLLDRVWEYEYTGDSRLVDAAIQRLRAKIEPDAARPTFIHTVRGVGYRLDRP
ncbi:MULTISPECIES: response regulator transcription factor [unclassified Luteococcus]|uniref:response regulator transcription factor n=1 Tax=unclassified Luteococcus TaxID=2639923 RepID=UPI00313CF7EB